MARPYRLGENAKLYYSTSLATSTTFTLPATVVEEVKDVKVGGKHDQPEYTTRKNLGVKQYAVSLTDLTVTCQIKVPGAGIVDVAYNALRDAWMNKDEIAIYALSDDKSIAGAEGPGGNFTIGDWSREEGNGQVQFVTVEFKPSTFNKWHVVP